MTDSAFSRRVFLSILLVLAVVLSGIFASGSLPSAGTAGPPCSWAGVERIVAIGDIHGDAGKLESLLKATGLVDGSLQWVGGRTHLVQTGDIMDRGSKTRIAWDLLMELEPQARASGGYVHVLLGNHEYMNITGDHRYLSAEDVVTFGGMPNFLRSMGPLGTYGAWLRNRNTVIRINDILFVHGGLSPHHRRYSMSQINQRVRMEIREYRRGRLRMGFDRKGPLWYRGFTEKDDSEACAEIDAVAKRYGAKRVVVGHTITEDGIESRCGGALIMIDTGMSEAYEDGPAEALEILPDRIQVITLKGTRPLLP
ncbi:MAG TPA: metallophosphoesterase [Thermoanaerobaculia bacterium]|nr:metallophosphoesterase [Thermoanaerobaculia bacterium]HUM30391.1 metallophosphoesterase [Thermoanaerobaculia bacterium]HXK68598.1 metallophosphoesterase [Thermoanaerobaculia bacterium]